MKYNYKYKLIFFAHGSAKRAIIKKSISNGLFYYAFKKVGLKKEVAKSSACEASATRRLKQSLWIVLPTRLAESNKKCIF